MARQFSACGFDGSPLDSGYYCRSRQIETTEDDACEVCMDDPGVRCVNHAQAGKIRAVATRLYDRAPLCSECAFVDDRIALAAARYAEVG